MSTVASRLRLWAAGALVVLAVLAAYSNSYHSAFHFDDSHVLEGNLYVRNLANAGRFFLDASTFSAEPKNATYRPLVTLSLAIDYRLGRGLDPVAYHVSQLVQLLLLGALLWWFYARVLGQGRTTTLHWALALCAAALFTLHTTATETMNLMHARSEILSAMGIVGAFLLYLGLPAWRRTYLYLVPMVLGALAKDPAVIFAPMLAVYIWLFEEQLPVSALFSAQGWPALRRTVWRTLPALVVGAAVFYGVESMNADAATYGGGDRLQYLQTQMFVWLHYGRLFLLPIGLTVDTDWGLIPHWYDTRVIAGIVFVAALLRLMWVSSRTPALRPVAFGIAWFGLGLLPASSIFPLAEVANEHRIFLPYIGASLALTSGLWWLVQRWGAGSRARRQAWEAAAATLAMVLLTGNAVGTYVRNEAWRTEETLWKDVTEKSPANGRGLMNYGLTQMAKGQFEEAKTFFDRAKVLLPYYSTLEVNLGIVTNRIGSAREAEEHFRRALDLAPEDTAAHVFYASWLADKDRVEEAIPHLVKAVAASPGNLPARYQLLDAYARTGKLDALQALVRETLAIAPDDATGRRYLDASGNVRIPPRAAAPPRENDAFSTAIAESLAAYRDHDFARSLAAAQQAATLRPESAEAHNNVAAAYASLEQWDQAIAAAEEAIRLKPDFQLARNNLAWAQQEKQKRAVPTR